MATIRRSLPKIDMRFVFAALAAAAVVALTKFVIMKAPSNQLTAPIKKVVEQI